MHDDEIKRLERELEEARYTIISLAPEQFHSLLYGYAPKIETDHDLWQWRHDVVGKVIEAAEAIEQLPESEDELHRYRWDDNAGRVACPLCGSRGSGAFGRGGWIVPGGLEMHLEGTGRAEKCGVLPAAFALIAKRTESGRLAAAQAEADALAQRRKAEPALRLDPNPNVEPVLLVGERYFLGTPRLVDQFAAINDRLT